MRSPINRTVSPKIWKGLSFPEFLKLWKTNLFEGKPEDYYTKWTGEKLPKKKPAKKEDDI